LKINTQIKRIILTGPESTGKTTLASELSDFYKTIYYPELAREFIENLDRKYQFEDVEEIAKSQISILRNNDYNSNVKCVFFDTGLIITKVWFQEVFGSVPLYVNKAIKDIKIDLHLLCYPDIKWEPDNVRENGGKKRLYLFHKYLDELEQNNLKYFIIKGKKTERFSLAQKYISSAYCL